MRLVYGFAIAVALCTPSVIRAQAPAAQPDGAIAVKDGGIFAKGWGAGASRPGRPRSRVVPSPCLASERSYRITR